MTFIFIIILRVMSYFLTIEHSYDLHSPCYSYVRFCFRNPFLSFGAIVAIPGSNPQNVHFPPIRRNVIFSWYQHKHYHSRIVCIFKSTPVSCE